MAIHENCPKANQLSLKETNEYHNHFRQIAHLFLMSDKMKIKIETVHAKIFHKILRRCVN